MKALPRARSAWMWAAVLGLALATSEAASAAFFHLCADRFPFRQPGRYTLTPEKIEALRRHFDPELGWRSGYETPFGERPRSTPHGSPWLAVFGDSFVHGDEVGEAETWEEAFATRAGRDVLNLGVGGYGPDQALMLYRRMAPRLETPVVGLGFTGENVNRIVNRYRPFYFRETGLPYPKPRFELREGRLELVPQPLRSVDELARLADPATIEELGRGDDHYESPFPTLGFPYLRLALHPAVWRHATTARRGRGELTAGRQNLWRTEARSLYLAILDAFVAEARGHGHQPLLLLLAGEPDVRAAREERGAPGRKAVLDHCAARGFACFDAVGALAASGAPIEALFAAGGHPSVEGSRRLGEALHAFVAGHPALSRDLTTP